MTHFPFKWRVSFLGFKLHPHCAHIWAWVRVYGGSPCVFVHISVCVFVCTCVCTVQTAAHQKKVGDFHNYFFLCSSLIASPWLSFPGQNLKQNILFLWEENPTFYLFIYYTTDKCQGRYLGGFLCSSENLVGNSKYILRVLCVTFFFHLIFFYLLHHECNTDTVYLLF